MLSEERIKAMEDIVKKQAKQIKQLEKAIGGTQAQQFSAKRKNTKEIW